MSGMSIVAYLRDVSSRTIAFYPDLVPICGSVTATLMLCQLSYWEPRTTDSAERWIYKTQADMEAETGLTRYEQEGARKKLVERGFIEVQRRGVPGKLHYRINHDAVQQAWETKITGTMGKTHNAENPHCDESTLPESHNVEDPKTTMGNTSKAQRGKTPKQNAGNPQSITETTAETTAEMTDSSAKAGSDADAAASTPAAEQPQYAIYRAVSEYRGVDLETTDPAERKRLRSAKQAQLSIAAQLARDGWGVDDVLNCLAYLDSDPKRGKPADMRAVLKEIGFWHTNGRPARMKTRTAGGAPTYSADEYRTRYGLEKEKGE